MAGRPRSALLWTPQGTGEVGRLLAEEAAVAFSYNGATQAVMMATPADLEDFARGFSFTEGIAAPDEVEELAVLRHGRGIELQMWLAPAAAARLAQRRRHMAGPVGCGLCGLESLDEALRPPPPLDSGLTVEAAALAGAAATLRRHQPLHDSVRAAHAAAFWQPGGGIRLAREDVGRHNALDKLAGAILAAGLDAATGAVVMSSRLSIDLVQKCCRLGAPILLALSAPTAAAVEMAAGAGLTLVALAGPERLTVFTHPERIQGLAPGKEVHVA